METALDDKSKRALAALPIDLQSSLKNALQTNYAKDLQNKEIEVMIKYHWWLMDPKKKEIEWARLSFDQLMKMKEDRTKLYDLIQQREADKEYMFGRQAAIKAGIDPNDDPRNNPNWTTLTTDPKSKDASLLLSYFERWKQIAALKGLLMEMNEGLYRLDPKNTDPDRYLRELDEAENRRQGIAPLPAPNP